MSRIFAPCRCHPQPVAASTCPPGWLWQGVAFLLFRLFDIFKPQPARYFDEKVKNGFGVMTDDLFAGVYTLLALALLKFVVA